MEAHPGFYRRKTVRRKTSIIAALLLLLVGIGVLIYPTLSDYLSRVNGSYAIQSLSSQMGQTERETLVQQRQLAQRYNAWIAGAGEPPAEAYDEILDFGNGIMGYIQIPKIDANLPIYHGISDEVLAKGVGHLPKTAFPIGGEGSHTVLSGHTGLPEAELFSNLTELEMGDQFYIHILDEILVYQVDSIDVVLPSEAESLAPVPGEDYCTLVTCTPYGVNSHRLLVRGSRVEGSEEEMELLREETHQQTQIPWELILAAVAAGVVVVCLGVLVFRKKA